MRRHSLTVLAVLAVLALVGCTAAPTATLTPSPSLAPTPTPTSASTATASPGPTTSPTATPTVAPTARPTSSPTATPTASPTLAPPTPTAAPSGWVELTGFPTYGRRTHITGIAYGGGRFVAVGWSIRSGNTRGRVWTSTDGRSWTAAPDTAFAGLTLEAVTHSGTAFYAFASAPTSVWRSSNGTSWQRVNLPEAGGELGTFNAFTGGSVIDATADGGTMYAAGETTLHGGDIACDGTCVAVWRSTNGTDWDSSIVVDGDVFGTFAVRPGLALVITYGNYIGQGPWYSTDFDSWSAPPGVELGEGSGLLDAASDGSRIVAVGYAGDLYDEAIALVTDGNNWTIVPIDSTAGSPAEQVAWAGGKFVAIGAVTWWSADGLTWQRGPDVPYPPPDDPGPEPGDDPFVRRTVGAGGPAVVLAQTYDEGLHVWFAPLSAFDD